MPLPMPKGTRSKLIEELSKSIERSAVFSNGRINTYSLKLTAVQELIAQGSNLNTEASAILGEQHITTFVRSEIAALLLRRPERPKISSRFAEIYSAEEAAALAKGLISAFESLPWRYHFSMPLPGLTSSTLQMDQGLTQVSPTIQLIAGWYLNAEKSSPPPHPPTERSEVSEDKWDPKLIYARIRVDGYVSSDRKSESVLHAHDLFFSLIGLLVAFKILESDYLWANGDEQRHSISVSLLGDQVEQHIASIDLDSTYQSLANDLGYSTLDFLPLIDSPNARAEIHARIIDALRPCTNDRISSAAKWFLDSHAGNNAQVKFVQLMIAFEIMLGDRAMSKETGIATLMANRCAYMIGKSSQDRDRLINAFKTGYDIRSRIVHAGTSRLTHKEKINFKVMQDLCSEVIQHEARMLKHSTEGDF